MMMGQPSSGLIPHGTVSNIEPSRYHAGSAYITVDLHQVNNRDPYVYKTTDYGKSWKSISSDIPKNELSYAHCVREDSVRKGLLYLGTENALYVSLNDGTKWYPLQNNLPHAPVSGIVVQEHFNDLVIATYGRGFTLEDSGNHGYNAPAAGPSVAGAFTREAGFLAFYEACRNDTRIWDSEGMVPYFHNGNQWVGYDDQASFVNKLAWIKDQGFLGWMVWNLDLDDFNGLQCGLGKYPLLTQLNNN